MIKKMMIKWFWNRKIRTTEKNIDLNKSKSILFLKQNENPEEMLASTAIFREIKKRYPEIKIGVVLLKEASEILKNNPHVDEIHIYDKGKVRDIRSLAQKIKKTGYEIIIDKQDLAETFQKLGIAPEEMDLSCDIHIADHNLYRAQAFKSFLKAEKVTVIYEPEIGEELLEKIRKISSEENSSIVFLFPEEKRKTIEEKVKAIPGDSIFPKTEGFQDILALISIGDEVITSDPLLKKIAAAGRENCLER